MSRFPTTWWHVTEPDGNQLVMRLQANRIGVAETKATLERRGFTLRPATQQEAREFIQKLDMTPAEGGKEGR
jgi:hypothetical protein